ncbi:MAG: hypothetical protein J2P28_14555 [Actinobacteria bacterium]|nr:hypothetical protein [Actinomycetota bacterium]
MLRVRRSQGAGSGLFLVLLGLWGALVPFVGPYFHYAYTPDRAWAMTAGRTVLEIVPGIITLLAGVVMFLTRSRFLLLVGACLAALAGAWFAVGGPAAASWTSLPATGKPAGHGARILLEQLGFFTGVGALIVFVAAVAIGRLTVLGAVAEADDWQELDDREPPAPRRNLTRITPVPVFRAQDDDEDDDYE